MRQEWQVAHREKIFFTWSVQQEIRGFEITEAKGPRFKVSGQGWMWDLESQIYNVSVGHCHPRVTAGMIEQIKKLPAAHPHALLPIRLETAEILQRHTGLYKSFFTTGGSEAVENSIKIARLVTGRSKIITRRTSYHGATLAVLGISGDPRKMPFEQCLMPAFHIEDPYPVREAQNQVPSDWLENLTQVVERENPDTVAAILLEGMTGVGGMQTPPKDFWPGAREICDRYGIVLIDDEIFSGFGRTGLWWAYQHWGAIPDVVVLGKGLTSGYAPMGAALISEKMARRFENERLWCGLTHFAHPVSCAAAVATMKVIEEEKLVENAACVGEELARRLTELRSGRYGGRIRNLRGKGFMQTIVFDRPVAPFLDLLWKKGVFAPGDSNMMFICPPLCLTAEEMNEVVGIIESALKEWN